MKTHGTEQSARLLARSREVIPGGVNSPARAFGAVGTDPLVIDHALDGHLWDADGNRYVDFVLSWGALLLGHAHPAITHAVQDALSRGTSYGAPTGVELELAELVTELVPSVEMVRFTNSGTEATMSAVRLARAATGRERIVKCAGGYHGHGDSFLVRAGSGVATLGLPNSPGVPESLARLTSTVPFNDVNAVGEAFSEHGDEIACVIVEPVMGNAGLIPPADGYLEGLRRLTRAHDALLISDEVMTGFRVALGGAQERFGVTPDLTTLGKVIGGGLPVGAFGGSRELMNQVAPAGPVYQAGTLSGNPLAMAAGIAQLLFARESAPYERLERLGTTLVDGLSERASELGVPLWGRALGGMWGVHFTDGPVRDYADAQQADSELFARFFRSCLQRGVYLPASPYEAAFVSAAHGEDDAEFALERMGAALEEAVG